MKHRVPVRNDEIVAVKLSEYLRRKYKAEDEYFESVRKHNAEVFLHECRDKEENESENAVECALIIGTEQRANENENNDYSKHRIRYENRLVFLYLTFQNQIL